MSLLNRVYLVLAVGIVAGSQAGNLIRIGDAHPLAIAAWRLLLASLLLAPAALPRWAEVKKLDRSEVGLLFFAAAAIAAHLLVWVAAVQNTTVANASMAFSINPVITATGGYLLFGERISKKLLLSIAFGLAGVAAIGWSDLSLQPRHLLGDGLAVLSSLLFTLYFLAGKRLRQKLPIALYVTLLYGIAGAMGLAALSLLGMPIFDYSDRNWLCFVSLAVVPTAIGHSSLNYVLKYLPAGSVSTAILGEPLLAGVVAYWAWNESMTAGALAGYALICLSVVALVWDRRSA